MNELNKELAEQVDADSCQGTNCGTTTGDHSSECLAEAAAGQGWELKPGDLCGRDCPIHKILAEQAEAERVEVVAFRYHCTNAEGEPLPGWFYSDDAGTLGLREPLMTVAQHERIVGALRAANAKLEKELAMARDAASKGNTARQQCGGMEMEIEDLRAEAQALREEVAALCAKLSDLPGWLRSIYEWGYVGGQNNPNGYIDEEDRDKWVNDILVRNHIST